MGVLLLAIGVMAATFGLIYLAQTVLMYWAIWSKNGALVRASTRAMLGRIFITGAAFFVAALAFSQIRIFGL